MVLDNNKTFEDPVYFTEWNEAASGVNDHYVKVDQDVKTTASPTFVSVNSEYVDMDLTPTSTAHTPGRLRWNANDGTLDVDLDIDSTVQVGLETLVRVYNNSGVTINNGTSVYPTGFFNSHPTLGLADASDRETIEVDFGITTTTIPNGSYGFVCLFGKARGIDTSSFLVNDVVYVGTTPGTITNIKPEFPDYALQLGVVAISGVSGEIYVVNKGELENTLHNFWNGSFRETINFLVASDGATITGTLENADLTNNLTMLFSDGMSTFDCTPAIDITLTAGTSTNPQKNFVYILKSTKALTVSTAGWAAEEHIKIAYILLRDAVTTQADDALINQNWNDHIEGQYNMGHMLHITERLRQLPSNWSDGVLGSTMVTAGPSDVHVAVTSGHVYQLHKQTFPAEDTSTGSDIHIMNDFTSPLKTVTNLNGETSDALGVTLTNSSFSFVLWGIQNKTGEESHLMINKPIGKYSKNTPDNAVDDLLKYSVYTIPNEYKSVGFLIARFTYTLAADGTTWTLYDTQDLRGQSPSTTAGGAGGGAGVTEFTALTDVPASYVGQAGKHIVVNGGETAVEFVTPFDNLLEDLTPELGGSLDCNNLNLTELKNAEYLAVYDNGNSSTAATINWSNGDKQQITLTGNCVFTFSNGSTGSRYELTLIQDATGSRIVTWDANCQWSGGVAPTLTTSATAEDMVTFSMRGIKYRGVETLNFS